MSSFFTSDHHFFHSKVLDFTDRPFLNVEEMNEFLIDKWNKTISKNDTVYHLGDFVFHGFDNWKSILSRLHGKIILIRGNHDSNKVVKEVAKLGFFEEVYEVGHYIKINKQQLWLSHYPMQIGDRPNKFSIHGHLHEETSHMLNQINVGVDSLAFADKLSFGEPVPMEILMEKINELNPILKGRFETNRENGNLYVSTK